MHENITIFSSLMYPDSPFRVVEFEHVKLDGSEDTRIFFKPTAAGEKLGFDFYITRFHTIVCGPKEYPDPYDDPGFHAECLFYGTVSYDGLRHLWMGDKATDNENYLYYVGAKRLAEIFALLHELEKDHCNPDLIGDV